MTLLRRRSLVGALFPLLFVAVGVAMLGLVVSMLITTYGLRANWVAIDGVVVKINETTGTDRAGNDVITYQPVVEYRVGDRTYRVESETSTSQQPVLGQRLPVRYNPADPSEAAVEYGAGAAYAVLGGLSALFLILGIALWFGLRGPPDAPSDADADADADVPGRPVGFWAFVALAALFGLGAIIALAVSFGVGSVPARFVALALGLAALMMGGFGYLWHALDVKDQRAEDQRTKDETTEDELTQGDRATQKEATDSGKRLLTAFTVALLVLGLGLLLGPIVLTVVERVQTAGWRTTDATVVSVAREFRMGSNGTQDRLYYRPTVEFSVDGSAYRFESRVASSTPIEVGSLSPVRYNPADPRQAFVDHGSTVRIVVGGVGVALIMLGLILFSARRGTPGAGLAAVRIFLAIPAVPFLIALVVAGFDLAKNGWPSSLVEGAMRYWYVLAAAAISGWIGWNWWRNARSGRARS